MVPSALYLKSVTQINILHVYKKKKNSDQVSKYVTLTDIMNISQKLNLGFFPEYQSTSAKLNLTYFICAILNYNA